MQSVLVFDSGVGGLSVFKEIATILPGQHVIYAFDNEAFPYGELEDKVLIERVCKIVDAICLKENIGLVVIACNTASTLVLPVLRERLSIPVVGVVPAIKPAAALSRNKKIGLLATPATIKRDYTFELIEQFAPDCEVELVGSTALVYIAEAKLRGAQVDLNVLQNILQPLIAKKVDCLVLGCTHFPLLKEEIKTVLGESCQVIDSGKAIAERVEHLLKQQMQLQESMPTYIAMSTTKVEQENALNLYLSELGFSHIIRCPAF